SLANNSHYGKVLYTTETNTKRAIIQAGIYFLYLICLSIICNFLTADHIFYFTYGMRNILQAQHPLKDNLTISFSEVITIEDFWNYIEFVPLRFFYDNVLDEHSNWEPHFASERPNLYGGILLNENLLLGAPRLRQVRVRDNTCLLHPAFFRYYNNCIASYSKEIEYSRPDYKGTKYKTLRQLRALAVSGRVNSYTTGGYVQSLSMEKDLSLGLVRHLQKIKWVDEATRLLIFEFNMLNINLSIMQGIKLIFEVMPSGLINTRYLGDTIYAHTSLAASGSLICISTLTLYSINFYYTYVELKKLLFMSLCCTFYLFFKKDIYDRIIALKPEEFISLDHDIFVYNLNKNIMGILIFLCWMSLLYFMSFNLALRRIGHTISLAAKDLCAFTVIFLIIITAFGNLAVMLFGADNTNFRDFSTAFVSMVRISLTDFHYFELERESPLMAPIFFLSYVMIMFFVLFNIYRAIIVLAYRSAAKTTPYKPSFLSYYMKKQLYRLSMGLLRAPEYP
ncbi:hypothetical protein KR222_007175, partial [Zaprionus bogoriensis]